MDPLVIFAIGSMFVIPLVVYLVYKIPAGIKFLGGLKVRRINSQVKAIGDNNKLMKSELESLENPRYGHSFDILSKIEQRLQKPPANSHWEMSVESNSDLEGAQPNDAVLTIRLIDYLSGKSEIDNIRVNLTRYEVKPAPWKVDIQFELNGWVRRQIERARDEYDVIWDADEDRHICSSCHNSPYEQVEAIENAWEAHLEMLRKQTEKHNADVKSTWFDYRTYVYGGTVPREIPSKVTEHITNPIALWSQQVVTDYELNTAPVEPMVRVITR